MAPSTITKTSLLRDAIENEFHNEYEQKNAEENIFQHKKSTSQNTISPYYDETVSKTDPKFLAGLRQWEKNMGFVTSIRWTSLIPISLFHIITVTWFTHALIYGPIPKWQTAWFAFVSGQLSGFGVTAGAHRLWTHRSYKAKLPLQIILLICYSIAGQSDRAKNAADMAQSFMDILQNNIYNWVRDHRLHHKMSETSADPHDANRGFFFAHVGWLMMKKHPHVIREGSKIDMSDIANDPLLKFYNKYFNFFKIPICMILPTVLCIVAWDEHWLVAIQTQVFIRYMFSLNFTWSVNSVAHLWGNKPYDRNIMPVENWGVSIIAMGEGWHNYHHTFPWDYKAAEMAYFINVTTLLLDFFAKIGWVYDMKQASPQLIQAVIEKRNMKH